MPNNQVKPEKHVFNTVDVVALYLRKTFDHKQMKEIRKIVDFLTGNGDTFTYDDTPRLLKIQHILVKQFFWLGSVRYNRSELENMIKNLIHNHGITLVIEKPEL